MQTGVRATNHHGCCERCHRPSPRLFPNSHHPQFSYVCQTVRIVVDCTYYMETLLTPYDQETQPCLAFCALTLVCRSHAVSHPTHNSLRWTTAIPLSGR